ncbi:MAG TPA: hypothetical protein VHK69_07130 [Chitinophagaceae bacterium]|jgi:hypothetical protein|nr:hypothetical protein [Chitinophagaceae bacterium]
MLVLSCGNDENKPDVSGIKVSVPVERFEPAFFSLDTNNLAPGLAALSRSFPQFSPVFFRDILQLNATDPAAPGALRSILSDYRPIYDSLRQKYPDLNFLKRELEEGFRYVKHYYPAYRVPKAVTFIATFDAPGVILTPTHLGIGLHQYAGKHFSVYQLLPIQQLYPSYISRRFDKEYMSVNAMKAIVDDIYPDSSAGRPLIEQMIEKGKQWYLLDHFLPDAADSLKTGYTGKQLAWAEENEGNIWSFILSTEKDIYSIEPYVIQRYIGEAPFTQNMPESSPGNLGQWVGWQIVRKFAGKKGLGLQEVLATPARTVYEEAAYRPK